MADCETFNIHQVAHAARMTTSLLRVWESRYRWPSPKRLANGYRVYSRFQRDELCRAAVLVREGMAIGSLIVDGLPRWPAAGARLKLIQPLSHARSLPLPAGADSQRVREELITACERDSSGRVLELVQSAPRVLRAQDELYAVLLPALTALCEMDQRGRRFTDRSEALSLVTVRCLQLAQRWSARGQRVCVRQHHPGAGDAAAAAALAAVLALRGCALANLGDIARPGEAAVPVPDALEIVVHTTACRGRGQNQLQVCVIGQGHGFSLAQIADQGSDLTRILESALDLAG